MLNEALLAGFLFFSPVNATEVKYDISSIKCLTDNMYHEARGQGTAGLLAVSSVVLNRVKDRRFPNTICEVVKQGPMRESWKKNGKFHGTKKSYAILCLSFVGLELFLGEARDILIR